MSSKLRGLKGVNTRDNTDEENPQIGVGDDADSSIPSDVPLSRVLESIMQKIDAQQAQIGELEKMSQKLETNVLANQSRQDQAEASHVNESIFQRLMAPLVHISQGPRTSTILPNAGLGVMISNMSNHTLGMPMGNPLILSNPLVVNPVLAEVVQGRRRAQPVYRKPYPDHVDAHELPRNYRYPDFSMYSGEENFSTVQHIARFTAQCGEAGPSPWLRMRLFSSSLARAAFEWYSNLPANSIQTWDKIEEAFHTHFYRTETKATLADIS
ncbi:uncharacterized protein LOC132305166 [Cornus florida]|uniref:uncharacterized protein LOC132305166 n=1 Tax=Cornus florida TaxID=4283 RepID=UPI002897B364|nr:uncharacterized protein LOC132305166 [Cornus florida]